MSIGLMMAGEKSLTAQPVTERVADDFYPTDFEITAALIEAELPVIRRQGVIQEPCCGEGDICQALAAYGIRSEGSDLIDRGYGRGGVDFQTISRFRKGVITNPPFDRDLPEILIRLALTRGCRYLALLLKEKYFYTKGRVELFAAFKPSREYKICWRPDFLKLGGGTMDVSWWVWDLDGERIAPNPQVFLLARDGRVV